jgi:subtilisin family serine protease
MSALLIALLGLGSTAFAGAPEAQLAAVGQPLGLHIKGESVSFDRFVPKTGTIAVETLSPQSAARVEEYLSKVPEAGAAAYHARALQSYLARSAATPLSESAFQKGPDGPTLTPIGRNLLVDILSARDGVAFKPAAPVRKPSGSMSAAVNIAGFDWEAFQKLDRSEALQRYAVDEGKSTVRLLVDGSPSVIAPAALSSNGAVFVRSIDNIDVLEVPLDRAASLAQELQQKGFSSRPAQAFRAEKAPVSPLITSAGPEPKPRFNIMNAESRDMLGVSNLWKAGMDGSGATVGLIDTGIDAQHPDFKDRIVEYVDLTGDGGKDVLGHGTHVAGSIAGSGAASDGRYAGMAPKAKLVVFKVFDKNGGTTEDVILEAMRRAAAMGVQVLNMSLGGPDDPETGVLSRMANKLAVQDNVLVVAAAGNSGPGAGTVSAPGNAEYALGVGGVDKHGDFPFFSSRGPAATVDGRRFEKPDLSAVAGGVDVQPPTPTLVAGAADSPRSGLAAAEVAGGPAIDCVYAPGVISSRSSDDADSHCVVAGNPSYRYLSGTSMAAPMASGIAADVAGWLLRNGTPFRAAEVKAAMMETATDLGQKPEVQGAGLISGGRLAQTVTDRASLGVPVGNVAYMLALRLTGEQRKNLALQDRFIATPLGLYDRQEGKLLNDDVQLHELAKHLDSLTPPAVASLSGQPVAAGS